MFVFRKENYYFEKEAQIGLIVHKDFFYVRISDEVTLKVISRYFRQ